MLFSDLKIREWTLHSSLRVWKFKFSTANFFFYRTKTICMAVSDTFTECFLMQFFSEYGSVIHSQIFTQKNRVHFRCRNWMVSKIIHDIHFFKFLKCSCESAIVMKCNTLAKFVFSTDYLYTYGHNFQSNSSVKHLQSFCTKQVRHINWW